LGKVTKPQKPKLVVVGNGYPTLLRRVSIDEEMANMVKFQHSYNAAARLITAMDEMIDMLVN